MKKTTVGWIVLASGALGSGCLTPPAGRIDVPNDLMRSRESVGQRGRYVVRMTDGEQSIELQVPEIATAYEVRVPLRGKPGVGGGMPVDLATMTAADKEIVSQREADARARAEAPEAAPDEPGASGGAPRPPARPRPASAGPDETAAPRYSYLLTLAKVKDLYRTRNYEIALVELVALEREYPNDERILSMKGSLYEKLGRRQLARDAWEAVLALNPYNLQVAEALQRLGK